MDIEKYDRFLQKETVIIWIVLAILLIVLVGASVHFVRRAIVNRGGSRKDDVWCLAIISIFIIPFVIYAAVQLSRYQRDIDHDLYERFDGEYRIVSVKTSSRTRYLTAYVALGDGYDTEAFTVHPDLEDNISEGLFNGYVVYSKNSKIIFDIE